MPLSVDEEKKARMKAMQLLERMDRTEKGLKEKLRQGGFSPEAAENAADYVKSFGYLDDARYARNYISGRMGTRGRQRLLQELYQRGISRDTALEAYEEAAELQETDEREVLRQTIRRKYPEETSLSEKELRRLYGFLMRRGFSAGDILQAVGELGISVCRPERFFSASDSDGDVF